MAIKTLKISDGQTLTYCKADGRSDNEKPGVIFLGGSQSDMNATKATAIYNFCAQDDRACVKFDYFGHGTSSGRYKDGTIGRWLNDTLTVIDKLTTGPLILVGSSLGGWLMLLATLHRPKRIAKLIGISAAPDFTHELIPHELSDTQKIQLQQERVIYLPNPYSDDNPYIVSQDMLDEAEEHLLLKTPIDITCPVHLFHGLSDGEVPASFATRIADKLTSNDVTITLVKNATHGFSKPEHLEMVFKAIANA